MDELYIKDYLRAGSIIAAEAALFPLNGLLTRVQAVNLNQGVLRT